MNVFLRRTQTKIYPSRSPLNYELTDRDHSVSYEKKIKDYVNENKISNRAIRKDAVLCDEWIITSDKSFFEKLSEGETREFLRPPKIILRKIMARTISLMQCPLRQHPSHAHGSSAFQDGKLSSKAMFDKKKNSKKFKKICQNT